MKINIPEHLAEIRPGAYLVGGSIRDLIRGLTPEDYDIAVSSDPAGYARDMARRTGGRMIALGKGRYTVYRVAGSQGHIDISGLKGPDILQDLLARDFTINALACDLSNGQILDISGGLEDLRRQRVRMVTPEVFARDPVRLVRAFRLAAILGFRIAPDTVDAIRRHADLLQSEPGERIWSELVRILACPDAYAVLLDMVATRLLCTIFPQMAQFKNTGLNQYDTFDILDHTLKTVETLEKLLREPHHYLAPRPADFVQGLNCRTRALLKVAALLQDIGRPACRTTDGHGHHHFHGHPARGAQLVQAIGRRLRMSNDERELVAALVRRRRRPLAVFLAAEPSGLRPPRPVGRFFRQCGKTSPLQLVLALAEHLTHAGRVPPQKKALTDFLKDLLAICLENNLHQGLPPLLTGRDLMGIFRLPPSPLVGTLLRGIQELQLGGAMTLREQAVQWVAAQLGESKIGQGALFPAAGREHDLKL
jgi:poly(A) polymerase